MNMDFNSIINLEFASEEVIEKITPEQIVSMSELISSVSSAIKHANSALERIIERKYMLKAQQRFNENRMSSGTVGFNDGRYSVKANIAKSVEWDQEMLADFFLHNIEGEPYTKEFSHLGDVDSAVKAKFTIDERVYKNLPMAAKNALEDARLETQSSMKIKVIKIEEK